ncbi:amidohydrolase family-domain-containing protein [Schizophyllum amplum]|uniref:Amidohydrolase family-domain-containing protein n=1 Tax=Schizophyllum amplum TaxID=97359 RepID=A0A550C5B1_9AGAR|nr:amidohydrolase family-domain-containing protein [Auriculariopsis ampla]
MASRTEKAPQPSLPIQTPRRARTWPLLVCILASGLAYLLWEFRENASKYAVCATAGVYTVDNDDSVAECFIVKGNVISAVGRRDQVVERDTTFPSMIGMVYQTILGKVTKVYDAPPGAIIVPGLADAHAHILQNGFKQQLQLESARSVHEYNRHLDIVTLLEAYLAAHPDVAADPDRWIQGMGWDQTKWPGQRFPTASDLSSPLLRDRFVALTRVDAHATWVSSRVLESMGSLPDTVEGGEIVRDADGNATGVFLDAAVSLIPTPLWSEADMKGYLDTTMQQALSFGLTSIHDAMATPEEIEFYMRQADAGKLPLHVYLMAHTPASQIDEIPRLENYGKHGRLSLRAVKMFTDGALGSWGAALLAPYTDRPETSGIMRASRANVTDEVRAYCRAGWQVNIHCIGDRANRLALDVFESVMEEDGVDPKVWRPRIEHAQIMTAEDLQRVGKMGVIPSVQPTHATSDMWYAEDRLGPDRIQGAYAYRTLREAASVLPLGSDFPVEGVNPLAGFYAAVARTAPDGSSPHGEGGWFPAQRLTRAQALRGMTRDAAYASFQESKMGRIQPGYAADFVVLDRNIMSEESTTAQPGETVGVTKAAEATPAGYTDPILATRVLATVVGGKVAYGSL